MKTRQRLPSHLSVSSVQLYARCPLAWQRRYVMGEPETPSPAMEFGRVFAAALEALHRGQDYETEFARGHAHSLNAQPGAEHGLRLLNLYAERFNFTGTPERKFRLHLPDTNAVPVPILGFLDLETDTEVVEFKTSRNPWTQARADREYQSAVYGWAFQQLHHKRPTCVRYLVFSTSTVDVQVIETHPTGDDLRLFEIAAGTVWNGITNKRFAACGKCRVCTPKASEPEFVVTSEAAR